VAAAEGVLQLIAPRAIEPERLRPGWAPVELLDALERGDASDRDAARANRIGQVYFAPVVLLIDALSSGATDFLIAGFADHELGEIVSVGGPPATVGHDAWSHRALRKLVPEYVLSELPYEGADFRIPLRRGLRAGRAGGRPLDQRPVRPDRQLDPRPGDDPVARVGRPSSRDRGRLAIGDARLDETALVFELETDGLDRVDVYVDDRPVTSLQREELGEPLSLELRRLGPAPGRLVLQGYRESVPAARLVIGLDSGGAGEAAR
jgi:hypothetical protein